MTDIIEDNVDVELQIGTEGQGFSKGNTEPGVSNFDDDALFWDAVEIKVEITQAAIPNYVKAKVTPRPETIGEITDLLNPDPDETDAPDKPTAAGNLPNNGISKLVGSRFRLEVDNDIVAVPGDADELGNRGKTTEVTPEEEDNLLFDGRLANISPIGTNIYEIVAYDPGQQAFNIGEESGSIINQKLQLSGSSVGSIRDVTAAADNNVPGDHSVPANEIATFIAKAAGIKEKKVIPKEDFLDDDGNPINIEFKKSVVTAKKALNKVREATRTEWWFSKDGTFYFGNPAKLGGGVETYEISLIKDTTAGISTPPYQSVRVIGSGIATSQGWVGNSKIQDDSKKITQEVNIGFPDSGGSQAEIVLLLNPDTVFEPTFKYINAELSTLRAVQNTALKIADDLIKQQASGKVTVVGFPEIEIFDGILMPNTEKQPMGGQLYDVYAVRHKINASDGFITEIEVAGPNPRLRDQIEIGPEGDRNIVATSLERDVYTNDGERRTGGAGVGLSGVTIGPEGQGSAGGG